MSPPVRASSPIGLIPTNPACPDLDDVEAPTSSGLTPLLPRQASFSVIPQSPPFPVAPGGGRRQRQLGRDPGASRSDRPDRPDRSAPEAWCSRLASVV